MKSKECEICREVKPLKRFYTNPASPDMYMNICRLCTGCTWDALEDDFDEHKIPSR